MHAGPFSHLDLSVSREGVAYRHLVPLRAQVLQCVRLRSNLPDPTIIILVDSPAAQRLVWQGLSNVLEAKRNSKKSGNQGANYPKNGQRYVRNREETASMDLVAWIYFYLTTSERDPDETLTTRQRLRMPMVRMLKVDLEFRPLCLNLLVSTIVWDEAPLLLSPLLVQTFLGDSRDNLHHDVVKISHGEHQYQASVVATDPVVMPSIYSRSNARASSPFGRILSAHDYQSYRNEHVEVEVEVAFWSLQ
ncbi:hypothetical protein F5146DRAFT_1002364 [Armillaria mellea]|nr:hypothetical protein F5146DRAFT_1002364 [Armillaria mellea]